MHHFDGLVGFEFVVVIRGYGTVLMLTCTCRRRSCELEAALRRIQLKAHGVHHLVLDDFLEHDARALAQLAAVVTPAATCLSSRCLI